MKEDEPLSHTIEANIEGKRMKVSATDVMGVRLSCNVPDSHGTRVYLLSDFQACDKVQFWKLWKLMGGKEYTWEDGEPFRPDVL